MINKYIRVQLPDDAIVFDNPAFDDSIVGYTEDDCVVYDYDEMISELTASEDISYDDAMEFIEYNTIRAIPYAGEHKPIIIYRVDRE